MLKNRRVHMQLLLQGEGVLRSSDRCRLRGDPRSLTPGHLSLKGGCLCKEDRVRHRGI
jgi:hypothetical protein